MHDLDRIQAELADDTFETDETLESEGDIVAEFEEEGDLPEELEDDEFEDEGTAQDEWGADEGPRIADESPLDESEEVDLASELLAAANEEELEQVVQRVVRPRPARPHRRRRRPPGPAAGLQQEASPEKRKKRRKRRRSFLGSALKGIAKKALPIVGGAVGSLVAPGVGSAAGAALASKVGKAFGLELEGLSAEDSALEVARRIVRLGAEAADETDQIDPSVDDATAAKVGMIRAAGKHAPGVMPRPDGARGARAGAGPGPARGPGGRRPVNAGPGGQSGRWVRRGDQIVLLGV
jgi:hypothetical protein